MPRIGMQQWIMAGIAFVFSIYFLVSAIWFPHWRATWGGRRGPGIPMSVRGKAVMSAYVAFWAISVLLSNTKAGRMLLLVVVALMIAIIPVWWQDYRDSRNS